MFGNVFVGLLGRWGSTGITRRALERGRREGRAYDPRVARMMAEADRRISERSRGCDIPGCTCGR